MISETAAPRLLKHIRFEFALGKNPDRTVAELAEKNKLLNRQRAFNALEREASVAITRDLRPAEPAEIEYVDSVILGIVTHLDEIDRQIQAASSTWKIERMSTVDRNILRLGSYELLHMPSVPSKVVINEAILLSRLFSDTGYSVQRKEGHAVWSQSKSQVTHNSAKFVNGVLDKVARESGRRDLFKARK